HVETTLHLHRALLPSFSSHSPAPPPPSTLSLHDALPIFLSTPRRPVKLRRRRAATRSFRLRPTSICRSSLRSIGRSRKERVAARDRKSTRLNSSHVSISYAVFCLKKKKKYVPQQFLLHVY